MTEQTDMAFERFRDEVRVIVRALEAELSEAKHERQQAVEALAAKCGELEKWKACAELLAACVPGICDQDCDALNLHETLKGS